MIYNYDFTNTVTLILLYGSTEHRFYLTNVKQKKGTKIINK